jgi:hypothetical protein
MVPSQSHSGSRRWVYLFNKGLGSTCLDQRYDLDEELLLDFFIVLSKDHTRLKDELNGLIDAPNEVYRL